MLLFFSVIGIWKSLNVYLYVGTLFMIKFLLYGTGIKIAQLY